MDKYKPISLARMSKKIWGGVGGGIDMNIFQ